MIFPLSQPVSVLMPVCNEAAVIAEVVAEWDTEVFQHLPAGSELIFDDGDSRDGTLDIIEGLRSTHPYIRVLRSKRDGFAASARRLYAEARCPLVFFTDSDGQYVPREFWRVAQHIGNYDLVHGAKLGRKDPLYRRFASSGFNRIVKAFFFVGIDDVNSAFRLMSKPMVDDLLPAIHCMPTLLNAELLLRADAAGYSIKQVDVAHRPRKFGESRGLPPARFAQDCRAAYRGLLELGREIAESRRSPKTLARTNRVVAEVKR